MGARRRKQGSAALTISSESRCLSLQVGRQRAEERVVRIVSLLAMRSDTPRALKLVHSKRGCQTFTLNMFLLLLLSVYFGFSLLLVPVCLPAELRAPRRPVIVFVNIDKNDSSYTRGLVCDASVTTYFFSTCVFKECVDVHVSGEENRLGKKNNARRSLLCACCARKKYELRVPLYFSRLYSAFVSIYFFCPFREYFLRCL